MKTFRLPLQKSYPKKIHFGSEVYLIKFKKGLSCYGMTDSEKKVITIKDGLGAYQLFTTLIHEIIHVIEFETPIKIRHKTVYKLEKGIVEILLENFL